MCIPSLVKRQINSIFICISKEIIFADYEFAKQLYGKSHIAKNFS